MKLWMLGWSGNEHAEMGYMLFSYTFAETRAEAINIFWCVKNEPPYSADLYPEQEDLEEWKAVFKKSGDWIE